MTKRGGPVYVAPPTNQFSARLEHVREKVAGAKTLKEFVRQLEAVPQKDGSRFRVSYSAARYYHYEREPSLAYAAHVATVFGVRIEWLLEGDGPVTKAETVSRAEAAQRLRIAVYRAVRAEIGSLMPIGIDAGHLEAIMAAVPAISRAMQIRGDSFGIDDGARYLAAATALGRAIMAPLEVLSIDVSEWPEAVKAQFLIQSIAALMVPIDLAHDRAVREKNATNDRSAVREKKARARRSKAKRSTKRGKNGEK